MPPSLDNRVLIPSGINPLLTVGLGRTRNRHTCNRDMRPSSPSSFSVPLGYRAPQQAPTETRFRTCASADPSPGNEIAAGPNGPTLPDGSKKLNMKHTNHTNILVKRALSTATRLSTPMRHPRETGPSELRPLGRGQANLPGNVVAPEAYCRHTCFRSVLPRQWSAAPAGGARRPTEHRTHR